MIVPDTGVNRGRKHAAELRVRVVGANDLFEQRLIGPKK